MPDEALLDHRAIPAEIPLVGWKIAVVSLSLFALFFTIDHESRFAGVLFGTQDEEEILDRYVEAAEGNNASRQAAVLGLALSGAILAVAARRPWRADRAGAFLLIALVFWACLSLAWAEAPTMAAKRLIVSLSLLVGAIGLARFLSPAEYVRVALISLTAFVFTSLLLDIKAGGGPWHFGYRFGGTLHPNVQASYCSALCLAALALATAGHRRALYASLFALGFLLLYLTGSRTNMLGLLLAMLVVWLVQQSPLIRTGAFGGLLALFGGATALFFSLDPALQRQFTGAALMGRTDQANSLSGRIPLWRELLQYASEHWVAGYGYESFWTPGVMEDILKTLDWSMTSAHNAYLEVALQLGIVGLGLALPLVLIAFLKAKKAYKQTHDLGYYFILGLLALGLANGLLESHFTKPKFPTFLAIIGLCSVLFFRNAPGSNDATERQGDLP